MLYLKFIINLNSHNKIIVAMTSSLKINPTLLSFYAMLLKLEKG